MTTELATRGTLSQNIEQVLIGGDLAQLKPDERLNYYNTLCASLGLNALTQPFQYIVLNGKLQLYAKKDCTEQLRKIHGVSITSVEPKAIEDLVVVVASAADRDGRVDSSTGAVAVTYPTRIKDSNGQWKDHPKGGRRFEGDDLANAMMKAETKAKRRVTLSLCGLGMLDETEVDTLKQQGMAQEPAGNKWESPNPTQAAVAGAEPTTRAVQEPTSGSSGEPDIRPKSQKGAQPPTQPAQTQPAAPQPQQQAVQGEVVGAEPSISPAQAKRFFAIMRSVGLDDGEAKRRLASIGWHGHRDGIPKRLYEQAIDAIDPDFKFHTPK